MKIFSIVNINNSEKYFCVYFLKGDKKAPTARKRTADAVIIKFGIFTGILDLEPCYDFLPIFVFI